MDGSPEKWLEKLITNKNTSRKITIITSTFTSTETPPFNHTNFVEFPSSSVELELFTSVTLLTFIILYGIVVFSGAFGNSTLLISLCSQSAARTRNPLLVALCSADLLVSLISAPLTIIGILLRQSSITTVPLANIGCKLYHYFQTFPVAASSLCLLMLSLDRYATVKHSRFTSLRQKHYVPSVLAIAAWVGSSILCLPFLFAYKVSETSINSTSTAYTRPHSSNTNILVSSNHQLNFTVTFLERNDSLINERKLCISNYGADEWPYFIFIISYVGIAFICPCLGIIFNHLGVRRKLCALSLTARAQHGELPLPMPTILRRPTHMILVTGMTPNGLNVQQQPESSNEDFLSPQKSSNKSNGSEFSRLNNNRRFIGSSGEFGGSSNNRNQTNRTCGLIGTEEENRRLMETKFQSSSSRTPRSMRRIKAQQMRAARIPSPPRPPAELPLPQTSTLRSRKRLANILVIAGFSYALCWMPHVYCLIMKEFSINEGCSLLVREFFMLLGFAHSALSPILHWILNFNSLRQSTCQPFAKLSSAQRFLRSHLRFTGPPAPPASSTNEAALGPFHPKFIKQRPQQMYKPPASSHYLY